MGNRFQVALLLLTFSSLTVANEIIDYEDLGGEIIQVKIDSLTLITLPVTTSGCKFKHKSGSLNNKFRNT